MPPIVSNWGQTQFQRCRPLRQERDNAEARTLELGPPPNRRGDMHTLQSMPWRSAAITSLTTLEDWVRSPANHPVPAVIPNLHPSHTPSKELSTHVMPMRNLFLEVRASRGFLACIGHIQILRTNIGLCTASRRICSLRNFSSWRKWSSDLGGPWLEQRYSR